MTAPEHDVDRAGDRLSAVQGGGGTVQNLDALDGRYGEGVEIDDGVGNGAAVHEERGPAGPEDERPVQAEAVVPEPAQHQVLNALHPGELDVVPVDHREGANRVRGRGGDAAGCRALAPVRLLLRPGTGGGRGECQAEDRKEHGSDTDAREPVAGDARGVALGSSEDLLRVVSRGHAPALDPAQLRLDRGPSPPVLE